jgi:type I restriction enzyme S subunit
VGIVPSEAQYERYIISNKQLRARVNELVVDPLFAFYWFSSPDMVAYIQQRNTGSSVPLINLSVLRSLPIPLPPLDEQRAIAHILGTLDDKMELNRRMNETLEEMARAIFKSWFVDSELGEIPTGWKMGELGEVVAIHDSKRVPLSGRERSQRNGPYPYYGATSVMDHVDDYLFDGIYVLVGEDGSVVTVDDHPFTQYVWGKLWVNNHAHVLQGKGSVSTEHLLLSLSQTNIRAHVTGAVQLKLNQRNMKSIPFMLSSSTINEAFKDRIAPLFERLRAGHEESQTLVAIRDALLPRLISGELRIGEAERFVEAKL